MVFVSLLQNGQAIGIHHVVEVRVGKVDAVGMVAIALHAVSAVLLREIHCMGDLHLVGKGSRSCGLALLPGLEEELLLPVLLHPASIRQSVSVNTISFFISRSAFHKKINCTCKQQTSFQNTPHYRSVSFASCIIYYFGKDLPAFL